MIVQVYYNTLVYKNMIVQVYYNTLVYNVVQTFMI